MNFSKTASVSIVTFVVSLGFVAESRAQAPMSQRKLSVVRDGIEARQDRAVVKAIAALPKKPTVVRGRQLPTGEDRLTTFVRIYSETEFASKADRKKEMERQKREVARVSAMSTDKQEKYLDSLFIEQQRRFQKSLDDPKNGSPYANGSSLN